MPNFTRKAIKESFIKLLNERPLSQITIKDIVEDCGINRNSFYYHFEDLPALIEEIVMEAADRIIERYPSIQSIEECLKVAIVFALENKRAVLHIYNSVNRDICERHLWKMCNYVVETYIATAFADWPLREEDKNIIARFYQCECFGQVIRWLSDGMKDDILEQFSRFCELQRGMVEEMFRRSAQDK